MTLGQQLLAVTTLRHAADVLSDTAGMLRRAMPGNEQAEKQAAHLAEEAMHVRRVVQSLEAPANGH